MVLKLLKDKTALAAAAAEQAGTSIRHAIAEHGKARIIAATGASQFEFLEALTSKPQSTSLSLESGRTGILPSTILLPTSKLRKNI